MCETVIHAHENLFLMVVIVVGVGCEKSQRVIRVSKRYFSLTQKEPSRGVLRKRCSENMQQIYRRTRMPKCDFNKVAKQLY